MIVMPLVDGNFGRGVQGLHYFPAIPIQITMHKVVLELRNNGYSLLAFWHEKYLQSGAGLVREGDFDKAYFPEGRDLVALY